uniref:Uncharacterized protein n=1 Tax=Romanomermis culicivorax TaxID=13658 RepID=A0A915JNG3_ROMCU
MLIAAKRFGRWGKVRCAGGVKLQICSMLLSLLIKRILINGSISGHGNEEKLLLRLLIWVLIITTRLLIKSEHIGVESLNIGGRLNLKSK